MTTYNHLVEKLFCAPTVEARRGVGVMQKLDFALDQPSKAFASVHVGGTNGKGSVSTKIAAALQHCGKTVGLFTSPHIASFRERIRFDDRAISEGEVTTFLPQVFETAKAIGVTPSFFELITALAFLVFAKKKVDVAVIEVGLGGRLDTTNIINPLISVITSISYDHTNILGNTLEEIAAEKGGIIKPNTPVVLGPTARQSVFKRRALKCCSPTIEVTGSFSDFETENQAISKATLQSLNIAPKSIQWGVKKTPFCRFEIVDKKLPIVVDVAHNSAGLEALFTRISHTFPNKDFRAVVAFSSNKPYSSFLAFLNTKCRQIHLTHTDHPRVARLGHSHLEESLNIAITLAKNNNEGVVVCGTFYIMDEVRQFFGVKEPRN